MRNLKALSVALASLFVVVGCSSSSDVGSSTSEAVSGGTIANIAYANVGKGACSTNSGGGAYFDSSCTGNGGQPEYWCADFARWVWAAAGAQNTNELTAASGSFYVYGQNHGTLHSTPSVGDAVVFDYHGGGSADHVAIVTQVNGNGTMVTVSGDWGGQSGSEAHFSATSHVVNNGTYGYAQGSRPGNIGMTISGYISPIGGGTNASGCTSEQVAAAGNYGCACVNGQPNGGFCDGTGCTDVETSNAGKFGCACVDGAANGGFCPGSGCTAKETINASKFGCECVDHVGSGGFCPGTGCTALETENAAKFGCGCVDHKGAGGACPGTGCTAKETNDCAHYGAACELHKCK